MMRATSAALVVTFAGLLVCCSADSRQEQDGSSEHNSGDHYDGHKTSNLGPLGGRSLVREVRESHPFGFTPPYLIRQYDYIHSPYTGKRELWPAASSAQYSGYYGDGFPKRNFDEIDRSSMNTFVRKRNFDEIDQSLMPFPYATKRFYRLSGPNYLDRPLSIKRNRPEFPMDEIDVSQFPIGSKRSLDNFSLTPRALR